MLDQRSRKAELHLTYRCDLDCPGCNRVCFNKHNIPEDMTRQTFIQTLNKIEQLGFQKTLVIIGGEPTLHKGCVDFLRIGRDRGFTQHLWSNAYSNLAKEKISTVREEGLALVMEGTHKLNGAVPGFHNPYIFCSPVDMGTKRVFPCKWGTSEDWGYSVDEAGCVPCPIGTMIAHYMAPSVRCKLEDLKPIEHCTKELCKHCGSFLQLDLCWHNTDRSKITEVNGTKVTSTWSTIFA